MERKFKLSERNTTSGPSGHIAVGGIYPRDRSKSRMPIAYTLGVKKAGATPVVYSTYGLASKEKPPTDYEFHANLDPERTRLGDDVMGLILPGGGDIAPALYGQEPHHRSKNVSPRRDRFELTLLEQAWERDMPIFAICRGMQLLNVFLGGTLDQHLADTEGRLEHDRDRPRAEPAHGAHFKQGTALADVLGTKAPVNSHHHQGLDDISDELEEIGWADDGVLEAVVATSRTWVVGVQWHPEAMAPVARAQLGLFESFAAAAREYAARPASSARSA